MAQKHYFKNNCWHDGTDVGTDSGFVSRYLQRPSNVEEAKGQFESWAERCNNLGFAETEVNILPELIDDDLDADIGTEAGTELLQREEWMIVASMGPLFLSADNVELGMRDFDISHNWAEGFQRYPNIDIERKFVQNNLRGTGKSTLINALVKSAATCFGNKKMVRIMAPTGVAAFNIGGTTIHYELSISSEWRFFLQYKHISGDQCRKMQDDFKDTKLIIIDEYSMLGRAMLAYIDLRCRDIFAKKEAFGGVSVVLIFRQAGIEQVSFREALHRLSDGTSTIKDWHLFKTRDSTLLTPVELNAFKFALRLFPTKQAAHDYNCKRLVDLGKPIARVHSKNNCATASSAMSDDAKGLEKVLYLSIGARVMLRANLCTQYGLVNGAMGTIVDIVYASGCGSPFDIPFAIMVDFDSYCGLPFRSGTNIVPIAPQTSNWKTTSGTSCQRTQLPVVLSWAITVHKSQGLTLDRVVVDIGKKESLSLTFVALSRTRKLSDLAFSPMFTFERLQKIGKCAGLKPRLDEEERLRIMSTVNMS
ncbi:Atp-dependent dna helicase pif1 [Thalictrum thalictroides]|uniref:ATP-dependent DNA helicase n=1 Tax=Thalictrum thalictroides TaxID=46969 RepID=A0A7J6WG84_THATH|nr:Atp-dependent dna helicase pif1 [Thalictrum thalictroides]